MSIETTEAKILTREQFAPVYERWRHGGWYVTNVRTKSGACGCVSNNYPDKKWRIACDPRPFDKQPTFNTRGDAAYAEYLLSKGVTMDPEATLRLLDQSISDLDLVQAREALANYRQWRRRRGFEPQNAASSGKSGDVFADECEGRLIDAERRAFPALPDVNFNGTSFDELVRLRINACDSLRDASAVLQAMAPRACDYRGVPGGLDSYSRASQRHKARSETLRAMLEEITGEAELLQVKADMG